MTSSPRNILWIFIWSVCFIAGIIILFDKTGNQLYILLFILISCFCAALILGYEEARDARKSKQIVDKKRAIEIEAQSIEKAAQDTRLKADEMYNSGNSLARQQKFEAALRFYKSAIELNSSKSQYHSNYAATLKRMGRLSEAKSAYQSLIDEFPDYAKGLLELANLYASEKDEEAATHYYTKFIKVYLEFLPELNQVVGGKSDSGPLYSKSSLEEFVLNSIAPLAYSDRYNTFSLFSKAVQESGNSITTMPVITALESLALYSAGIAAGYMNNPEIHDIELQLIGPLETDQAYQATRWYLCINKNQGSASSYGLLVDVFRSSSENKDFQFARLKCGISCSPTMDGDLSNCVILANQHCIAWATESMSISSAYLKGNFVNNLQELETDLGDGDLQRQMDVVSLFNRLNAEHEPIIGASDAFAQQLVNGLVVEAKSIANLGPVAVAEPIAQQGIVNEAKPIAHQAPRGLSQLASYPRSVEAQVGWLGYKQIELRWQIQVDLVFLAHATKDGDKLHIELYSTNPRSQSPMTYVSKSDFNRFKIEMCVLTEISLGAAKALKLLEGVSEIGFRSDDQWMLTHFMRIYTEELPSRIHPKITIFVCKDDETPYVKTSE